MRSDRSEGRSLAYIVGHYKSGSTWLINLLSLHPMIRGVAETSLFSYVMHHDDLQVVTRKLYTEGFWGRGGLVRQSRQRLAEWARPIRGLWKPTLPARDRPTIRMDLRLLAQFALRRELLASRSKSDYCRRFFGFLRSELRPTGYLIEKNNNIALVPFINSVFPEAKLVAIHRDGRDVVVSEKFFLRNQVGREKPFHDSVLGWRRAMEHQFACEREYGLYSLSYESLLEDGPRVVHDLLAFLDLPADRPIVDDMLRRSSFEYVTGRGRGAENPHAFYRKGVVADWENHLGELERDAFDELAGDVLARLGYERKQSPARLGT